ncbi:MAG: thioredoxin family protein [Bacteroidales bacterium]|jgi:small redox-active disulfide protein 2|nr:thioredoxin family protein [Bacteroidales bacterium]
MKISIKILGTGCPKCKALEKLTKEVLTENSYDAEISKVEDIVQIMNYGVIGTPALVLNEKVLVSGRVPSKDEIKRLIEKYMNI